jgi:SAM-dependent methyltransferase
MHLDDLKRNWNALGTVDPLWAILAYPERLGNRWSPEEFFATGEAQVGAYFTALDELDVAPPGRGRALDFGCGAGRLTQALATRFDRVDGVDVATSMVDLARRHNTHPDRVAFHLNERPDLRALEDGSYDFILSIVVFQHMSNDLKAGYLREFVRVLAPGGVAMFTVPSHADLSPIGILRRLPNPVQNVYRRRRYGYPAVMEFHTYRRRRVERDLGQAGGQVLAVLPDDTAGPPFTSYLYVVTKPEVDHGARQTAEDLS